MLSLMPRKKSGVTKPSVAPITPEEADRQAQRFVDILLDKANPHARRAMLTGLDHPEIVIALSKNIKSPPERLDPVLRVKLKSALQKGNRNALVALMRDLYLNDPIPPEQQNAFERIFKPLFLRGALLEYADTLKGKPGKAPLVDPSGYPELARRADILRPVIQRLLDERRDGNKRTAGECLNFWSQQFPEACQFLSRHSGKLEELLRMDRLPKPAEKLETQAHVIADALAGCEEGLEFSTSIERVRQGRRMAKQSSKQNPAN
jgi:hypothetical protein